MGHKVISVMNSSSDGLIKDVRDASVNFNPDLVEARLDDIQGEVSLHKKTIEGIEKAGIGTPLIIAVPPRGETPNAAFAGIIEDRIEVLKATCDSKSFEFVTVEHSRLINGLDRERKGLREVIEYAHKRGKKVIGSSHGDTVPPDCMIRNILDHLEYESCDISKLAFKIDSEEMFKRLLGFASEKTAIIPMRGDVTQFEAETMRYIACEKSFLGYFRMGPATGPGQMQIGTAQSLDESGLGKDIVETFESKGLKEAAKLYKTVQRSYGLV